MSAVTKNDGGPAFPTTEEHGFNKGEPGMTLRDYFAAHSPIGVADANDVFYRNNGRNAKTAEMLAILTEMRSRYADAMLAERAK